MANLDDDLIGNYEVHLRVDGMMCQNSCGATVREALLSVPGSVSAVASFQSSSASVTVNCHEYCYMKGSASIEQSLNLSVIQRQIVVDAIQAIEAVGFDASERDYRDTLSLKDDSGDKKCGLDESNFPLMNSAALHNESLEDQRVGGNQELVLTFQVGGMSCASCTGRVEKALRKLPFIKDVKVNLATARVQVQLLDGEMDAVDGRSLCIKNIEAAGYECAFLETDLFSTNTATMRDFRDKEISSWKRRLIIACILSSPLILHHLVSMTTMHNMHSMHQGQGKIEWDEWLGLALATPVQFIVGGRYYKAAYASLRNGSIGMDFLIVLGSTVSYIYSLVLLLIGLFPVLLGDSTRQKAPFDTSAMLLTFVTIGKYLEARAKGETASALQGLLKLQDTIAYRCASIESLVTNGNQNHFTLKDGIDIKSLITNQVQTKELNVNDFLVVKPGGRIPTDGLLISTGNNGKKAYVDESALTGETFPVPKAVGDNVYGATLNQSSFLLIKVTAIGSATVLGNILRLVEQAQCNQAPIQSIADRISSIFAPVVISIAVLTLFGWLVFNTEVDLQERIFSAIMSAISVVVVACPCALGLATPTAVMVGTGVGASNGLLIKGGAVLEETHLIDTVVFDKTGTLTKGQPIVKAQYQFISSEDDDYPLLNFLPKSIKHADVALWLAGCVEFASEHPIGRAIVDTANKTFDQDFMKLSSDLKMTSIDVVPGEGVEGEFFHESNVHFKVRIGCTKFASFSQADCASLAQRGYTGVLVGVCMMDTYGRQRTEDRARIIGAFGIYDAPRPEAKSTVLALKGMGIDVWMCTGDHSLTARSLAKEVGIDNENVRAEVRPEDKAMLVEELEQRVKHINCFSGNGRHSKVAFVGDGINDSIALSRASVGIALRTGTSVAVDAADIVLTDSDTDLHDVIVAIHLSRVVFKRILYNFLWATAYNIFSIPFAAGLFTSWALPPAFAGMMMPFSSISVVLSSLLLKRYKKPFIDDDGRICGADMCSRFSSRLSFSSPRTAGFTSLLVPAETFSDSDLELEIV